MSRHYFDCECADKPVRVTLGYDRPLDEYFLQVELLAPKEPHNLSYLYTSISDPRNSPQDLDYYGAKLIALGIDAPASLFQSVLEDAINRRGNYIVEHFANGFTRTVFDELSMRH